MWRKFHLFILFSIILFGTIGISYGIIMDKSKSYQTENENNLPILIYPKDFKNGIAFIDLNLIKEVSQKDIIIVDGILEYVP